MAKSWHAGPTTVDLTLRGATGQSNSQQCERCLDLTDPVQPLPGGRPPEASPDPGPDMNAPNFRSGAEKPAGPSTITGFGCMSSEPAVQTSKTSSRVPMPPGS